MSDEKVVDEQDQEEAAPNVALTEVVPERTEDDIECQSAIEVVLAGKKVRIPVLPYSASKRIRPKFLEWQKVAGSVQAEGKKIRANALAAEGNESAEDIVDESVQSVSICRQSFVVVDAALDLFFLYAQKSNADRKAIEDTATEEELWAASQAVIETMIPLSKKADEK